MKHNDMIITYFKLSEKERRLRGAPESLSGFLSKKIFATGHAHLVMLNDDGTVTALGNNGCGQCDVAGWKDVVKVAAGNYHTVGLRSDGTVLATGDNDFGQCEVGGWKGVTDIFAEKALTVGVTSCGDVLVSHPEPRPAKTAPAAVPGPSEKKTAAVSGPSEKKTAAETESFAGWPPPSFAKLPVAPESDFDCFISDGGITIKKYTGDSATVFIPEKIKGMPVLRVAWMAFKDNRFLKTLVFPGKLTSIGDSACEGCFSLENVWIPGTVVDIYNRAFKDCIALRKVYISEGVQRICRSAFAGCDKLTEIMIPHSVSDISPDAFDKYTRIACYKNSYAASYATLHNKGYRSLPV